MAAPVAPVAMVAMVAMVALVVGGCWTDEADYEQLEQEAVVCPVGPQVPGIDVSYWQPNIDWNRVAADGIVFAFLRVSDGDPATGGVYDTESIRDQNRRRAAERYDLLLRTILP